jgi:N-acetylmuramoyl-L-alanine amidase
MTKLGVFALVAAAVLVVFALSAGNAGVPAGRSWVTVVVDAGHGGDDPGAIAGGVKEKDVTLALALRVAELARDVPHLKIILTRTTDTYVELVDRVKLAEAVGAVLYLSIHANYCSTASVRGIETYVDDSRPPDDLSWYLARDIQRAVCAATGAPDRGVRSKRLYLRHTSLPAALVEVGYLSSPRERELLLDPDYQERIARGIVQGIREFLGL